MWSSSHNQWGNAARLVVELAAVRPFPHGRGRPFNVVVADDQPDVLDGIGTSQEILPDRVLISTNDADAALAEPVELVLGQVEAVLSDGEQGVRADLSGDGPRLALTGWAELAPGYAIGSAGAFWTIQRTIMMIGGG